MNKATTEKALKGWRELNVVLHTLDEGTVKDLLDHEVKYGKRKSVIRRLHERYTMLRAKREREELLKEDAEEVSLL